MQKQLTLQLRNVISKKLQMNYRPTKVSF